MRAGGDVGVRGPGEACAAGANRGRQSRVGDRPPNDTGRDVGEEKERESAWYGWRKIKVESTNGIGCWKSGARDRGKIFGG